MVLPIYAYGHPILRKVCTDIDHEYAGLNGLIGDMWETMYSATGCGLAAPQIGRSIRLFVVDSSSTYEQLKEKERLKYFAPEDSGIQETFINARITARSPETWEDLEGCLSIPRLARKITRSWSIEIAYYDAGFQKQTRQFSGLTARMIQHEYDHIEGILYPDHLPVDARHLMKSKLQKISKGLIKPPFPMKFV